MIYVQDEGDTNESAKSALIGKAQELRDEIQWKVMDELMDYEEIKPKTKRDLFIETANPNCCNALNGDQHIFDAIKSHCPCFQRIHIVMESYRDLVSGKCKDLWEKV